VCIGVEYILEESRIRRATPNFLLWRRGFNPWQFQIRIMVGAVSLQLVSSEFVYFPLFIISPSLPHTHLSPPHEVWDSPEQAANYHTHWFEVRGFISDPAIGWSRNKVSLVYNLQKCFFFTLSIVYISIRITTFRNLYLFPSSGKERKEETLAVGPPGWARLRPGQLQHRWTRSSDKYNCWLGRVLQTV
jgi:hypothetical protein